MSLKVYSHGRPSVRGGGDGRRPSWRRWPACGCCRRAAMPLTRWRRRRPSMWRNLICRVSPARPGDGLHRPRRPAAQPRFPSAGTARFRRHPPDPRRDRGRSQRQRCARQSRRLVFLAGELGRLPLSQIFAAASVTPRRHRDLGFPHHDPKRPGPPDAAGVADPVLRRHRRRRSAPCCVSRIWPIPWRLSPARDPAIFTTARSARRWWPIQVPWRLPVAGRPGGGGTLLGNPDQRPFRRP